MHKFTRKFEHVCECIVFKSNSENWIPTKSFRPSERDSNERLIPVGTIHIQIHIGSSPEVNGIKFTPAVVY